MQGYKEFINWLQNQTYCAEDVIWSDKKNTFFTYCKLREVSMTQANYHLNLHLENL